MKSFFCFIICSLFTSILAQAQPPNISYTYEYPYSDGIPFFRYKERREMLRNSHSEKSLIISLSADIRNRQNDVNHPYRQSSNFLYLTGMPYPQSALILAPGGIMHEGKVSKEFLFINPRNSSKEAWEGALMGIEEAKMLDIETILPYSNLKTFVMEHLKGKDTIYFTGLPTANIPIPLAEKPFSVEQNLKQELHQTFPDLYIKTSMQKLTQITTYRGRCWLIRCTKID